MRLCCTKLRQAKGAVGGVEDSRLILTIASAEAGNGLRLRLGIYLPLGWILDSVG